MFKGVIQNISLWPLLIIICVILLCVLGVMYWRKKTRIIEGNFFSDASKMMNELKDINNSKSTGDSRTDAALKQLKELMEGPPPPPDPKWKDLAAQPPPVDDTITIPAKTDTSYITSNNCSKKSILTSDYAEDICIKYADDNQKLDTKCRALSIDNCNQSSCCILVNGVKCVAGNADGPTYLTDAGGTVDYNYYLHRGTTYPEDYKFSGSYYENCGKFSNNSTNISKACMVQMFNDAGCKNLTPNSLINDAAVYSYSKSSKRYIQNDLTNAATLLQKNWHELNDDESRILCYGPDLTKKCDKYKKDDTDISQDCMIEMLNNGGCPNASFPLLIDASFVLQNKQTTKADLKTFLNYTAMNSKQNADTLDMNNATSADISNVRLCYGPTVNKSPNYISQRLLKAGRPEKIAEIEPSEKILNIFRILQKMSFDEQMAYLNTFNYAITYTPTMCSNPPCSSTATTSLTNDADKQLLIGYNNPPITDKEKAEMYSLLGL